MNGHLEGEHPQLGDLLTMVINHLLNGMILRLYSLSHSCTNCQVCGAIPYALMVVFAERSLLGIGKGQWLPFQRRPLSKKSFFQTVGQWSSWKKKLSPRSQSLNRHHL